jgi:hypothetical protein
MRRIAIPVACAALLAATSTATAAGPGTYRGETSQGKPITIKVKNAVGPGVRIERVTLQADLVCPDGSPDQVSIDRLVIGGKVTKSGRFRLRMADLDISGRFVSKRSLTGSFDVSEFSCSAGDVRYRARRS